MHGCIASNSKKISPRRFLKLPTWVNDDGYDQDDSHEWSSSIAMQENWNNMQSKLEQHAAQRSSNYKNTKNERE